MNEKIIQFNRSEYNISAKCFSELADMAWGLVQIQTSGAYRKNAVTDPRFENGRFSFELREAYWHFRTSANFLEKMPLLTTKTAKNVFDSAIEGFRQLSRIAYAPSPFEELSPVFVYGVWSCRMAFWAHYNPLILLFVSRRIVKRKINKMIGEKPTSDIRK